MRCVRCEGPIRTKNNKPYCNHCGTQPPWDRSGTQILGRDPDQIAAITGNVGVVRVITSTNTDNVSHETPKGANGPAETSVKAS